MTVNAARMVMVQPDYNTDMGTRLSRTRHESASALHGCVTEMWHAVHTVGKATLENVQTSEYAERHRVSRFPKALCMGILESDVPPTIDDAVELRNSITAKYRAENVRPLPLHDVPCVAETDALGLFADFIPEPDYNPEDVAFTKPGNVRRFREITGIMADTYERKNADYGNSFGESIGEFGAVAGIVRIGDKFNRLKNLIRTPGTQRVNDESIADTLLDMANYCIMLKLELENPFTQYSK